jgi:hypothetical protein
VQFGDGRIIVEEVSFFDDEIREGPGWEGRWGRGGFGKWGEARRVPINFVVVVVEADKNVINKD